MTTLLLLSACVSHMGGFMTPEQIHRSAVAIAAMRDPNNPRPVKINSMEIRRRIEDRPVAAWLARILNDDLFPLDRREGGPLPDKAEV